MPNVALVPALAKTLLAIAWADGELHPEEEATLKEVMGLLPNLSAQDWALIELYLVTPISATERADLIQTTIAHIRSGEDKTIALNAVDAMMQADGAINPAEEAVARDVRAAFAAVDVSALGLLRRVVSGVFQPTPARETQLDLWRSNPIFYLLQAQTPDRAILADPAVELAALAAGIMAQVARVSPASAADERPVLIDALVRDWDVAQPVAAQIADAALTLTRRNVDYHRIARELARRTGEAQRSALLDTLFAIANAADRVAPDEIDEIRVITERLNLTREQFIAAKLKVPSADRGGL